jgi:hypothetical protein
MNIRKEIALHNEEAVMWDGLDDAIVGISDNGNVIYDILKMVEIMSNTMDEDDAVEWVNFNILSAHVGDYTPIHIYKI